jgi:CheY-like chemotaxis protein
MGVRSDPGRGSEFWFELPFPLDHTVVPLPRTGRPMRLLVVHHQESMRRALPMLIRSLGWEVEAVASGQEAIDRTRAGVQPGGQPFDAVIMNWQLPGLDGLCTSKLIRDHTATASLPIVILVSAHNRDAAMHASGAKLADLILTKPVTASVLHDAVAAAVGRRSETSRAVGYFHGVGPDAGAQRLSGLRILAVDDSEMNQEIAQRMLELEGAKVTLISNGQTALARLRAEPKGFDIVLMDVQMPVMDGLEATRRIRKDLGLTALPVIALSAGVLGEERERVLAAGMNDFLPKPYEIGQMVTTIRRWAQPPGRPEGPPVATPVPVATAPNTEFPPIVGIDRFQAAARLAGDRAFFISMLNRFVQEWNHNIDSIRADIECGTLINAARTLHKLRGGAGNLAAVQIADVAGALETALLNHKLDSVPERMQQLTRAMDELQQSAQRWLTPAAMPSTAANSAHATPIDDSKLQELVNALSMRRISVLKRYHSLQPELQARYGTEVATAIGHAVEGLKFDEAAARLQHLLDASQR